MKECNALIGNHENKAIGFSEIGDDSFVVLTSKYFDRSILRNKLNQASSALGITAHELYERLLNGETFKWPVPESTEQ